MTIFNFGKDSSEKIGVVESVDTSNVLIKIENKEKLKKMQVNHLVVIQSSKVGHSMIALVNKIMCNSTMSNGEDGLSVYNVENIVKATMIGTHVTKVGVTNNVFKRTLETVPEIDADCFMLEGERLTNFMKAISQVALEGKNPLSLGHYTLDDKAEAWLDGNKFFQRHAVIVGSTGSGKSWTVAKLLEQAAKLPSANSIVFDIHGEYSTLKGDGVQHIKIAGPNDSAENDDIIFLPYWLLTYEEMISLMLDRADSNAPNQASAFSSVVIEQKRGTLTNLGKSDVLSSFTIDSPIPYKLSNLISTFKNLDEEMVAGSRAGTEKQGPLFGKLTRFIQRLETKITDKRLNFLFNESAEVLAYSYMKKISQKLMHSSHLQTKKGIKIIDFSEVPSDVLPLVVSLIGRLVFSIQQWIRKENRHPIALFCDEAHLYLPEKTVSSVEAAGLQNFERIAKEGRKYGVALVVISQRPAEVNRTILSQSNNFIAMRLTNAEDQAVIKKLLPDSLGSFSDLLPILDIGEALVVGDASLLPSRIKISKPGWEPNSATINFWDEWSVAGGTDVISDAIEALRKQSR